MNTIKKLLLISGLSFFCYSQNNGMNVTTNDVSKDLGKLDDKLGLLQGSLGELKTKLGELTTAANNALNPSANPPQADASTGTGPGPGSSTDTSSTINNPPTTSDSKISGTNETDASSTPANPFKNPGATNISENPNPLAELKNSILPIDAQGQTRTLGIIRGELLAAYNDTGIATKPKVNTTSYAKLESLKNIAEPSTWNGNEEAEFSRLYTNLLNIKEATVQKIAKLNNEISTKKTTNNSTTALEQQKTKNAALLRDITEILDIKFPLTSGMYKNLEQQKAIDLAEEPAKVQADNDLITAEINRISKLNTTLISTSYSTSLMSWYLPTIFSAGCPNTFKKWADEGVVLPCTSKFDNNIKTTIAHLNALKTAWNKLIFLSLDASGNNADEAEQQQLLDIITTAEALKEWLSGDDDKEQADNLQTNFIEILKRFKFPKGAANASITGKNLTDNPQ